jgi:DNA-binding NtrC family response regulator
MSHRILVVSSDEAARNGTLGVLNHAGFLATGAASFEEASRAMSHATPDLLIADERLGDFNGLHLVVRGRAVSPSMRAIVISASQDAVLEQDAQHLNAECVVKPSDPAEWLGQVSRSLAARIPMSA